MNQNIRYKGLSLTPDELGAPNGTLAMSANAELHDGSLRPSVVKGTDTSVALTDGTNPVKLVYVHKMSTKTNLIAVKPGVSSHTLYWYNADGTHSSPYSTSITMDITNLQVDSIGNTLILIGADGVYYVLWKNNAYVMLGKKPPFVPIRFRLDGGSGSSGDASTFDTQNAEDYKVKTNGGMLYSPTTGGISVTEEYRTSVTQQVLARVNKRIAEVTDMGYFYAPFLVRYALRLFDGTSLILHSPPVLLSPLLRRPVMTAIEGVTSPPTTTTSEYIFHVYTNPGRLQFACLSSNILTQLQSWSDIVKSVDIFVTPQFSRIDNSKTIDSVSEIYSENNETHINSVYLDTISADFVTTYGQNLYSFDLPEFSEAEHFDHIRHASSFYLLASVDISDLSTTLKDVPYQPSDLKNISVREQMVDDYKTHNQLSPISGTIKNIYTYNKRLILYGLQETLYNGFPIEVLFPDLNDTSNAINVRSVAVTIKTSEGESVVVSDSIISSSYIPFHWFMRGYVFYPDSRAVKMEFKGRAGDDPDSYQGWRKLYQHSALNGACSFLMTDNGEHSSAADSTITFPTASNTTVPLPNKIYTSEVNNPFYFPVTSINTVGTGTILGVATTTLALTQGQFGQFPLIAFASDGIWALDVSNTGTFTAIHPISREVCTNPKSICQLDQQVVFATTRGLSTVISQNVVSLTDQLDGAYKPLTKIAPGLSTYFTIDSDHDTAAVQANKAIINQLMAFDTAPVNVFQTASIVYDFANSRLLVYPAASAGTQIVLVYSLTDKTWSTMKTNVINTAVNAYPHPYIQWSDGKVTCLDKTYPFSNTDKVPSLVVTRALSFGDAMYAINDLVHNRMATGHATLFIFGSNNLNTWHYIGRTNQNYVNYLPSHSYRYFRFAIYTTMTPAEQYISTSFNVKEKMPKL